jgi:hypothetical protein
VTGAKQCAREGCELPAATNKRGNRFCSFACRAVHYELRDAQQLCSAIGPCSTGAGELWAAAVTMSDALSEYQRLDRRLFSFAQLVGITPDEWYGLKHREAR